MVRAGQGVLLKLDFCDGSVANYKRPFLVINKDNDYIYLLNISSTKGKEHKLGMKSNKLISRYRPPFLKSSFVKLDSMYIVPNREYIKNYLLCEGRAMHPLELQDIKHCFSDYRENNKFKSKIFNLDRIEELNGTLILI